MIWMQFSNQTKLSKKKGITSAISYHNHSNFTILTVKNTEYALLHDIIQANHINIMAR